MIIAHLVKYTPESFDIVSSENLKVISYFVLQSSALSFSVDLCPPQFTPQSLAIHFDGNCRWTEDAHCLNTGLSRLGSTPVQIERWQADTSTVWHTTSADQAKTVVTEHWCLTAVWLDTSACQSMAHATEKAYQRMLSIAEQSGMPCVVRTWNYLPHINHGAGDQETYKLFCAGRAAAYAACGITDSDFAAASALGSHAEGAVFYQLSTRTSGQHFENPLQVSAYRYPRQYGPTSPSFARATVAQLGPQEVLFISGTASVRGHESLHNNSIEAQTTQTLNNIQTLLQTVTAKLGKPVKPAFLKVYIRHPQHLDVVKSIAEARYPESEFIYLLADICRAELLVEIDGHCWL